MRLLSALAPLLLASTAYAQAPGEMPPPLAQPVPLAPNDPWTVMANRFSVGFSIGQSTVTDNMQNKTDFSIGELALRYRLRPEWEAELIVGGGGQKNADGTSGDLQLTDVTLGLRYRFRPAEQLNWFLAAGIGASAIASSSASSDDRDNATRGHVQFGGGIEYRFTHFALQAEVRLTAMGQTKAENDAMSAAPTLSSAPSNVATPTPTATSTTNDNMTAGQVTVGASYYF
jgi:opacity protein-like surface antigen